MSDYLPVRESELRCVAYDLGSEWEALATLLDFRASDIQKFKIDRPHQTISLAIFDMLISWKKRCPDGEQRECLTCALNSCQRQDIAENLKAGVIDKPSPTLNPGAFNIPTSPTAGEFNLSQCREDLCWTYLNDVCQLPIYPWEKSNCMGIEDVFTNLSIILDLPQPFRSLKVPLSSYEEIFTQKTCRGDSPNRMIIQGEAGTGKSTLCAKFAYDWAKGGDSSYLRSSKTLLFLLRMRDLEEFTSLEDAIIRHLLPTDTSITGKQLSRYLNQHSDKCCILLDGYDESCFLDLDGGDDIANILSCKTLRRCLVIVTSRPERLAEFDAHRKHYMNYEVVGFSADEVETYIRHFFGGDDEKANDLIEFIEMNSMKIGMASTPLVTHLLCLYWKHSKDAVEEGSEEDDEDQAAAPTTMTKLQNALFTFMEDHYIAKGTSDSTAVDLEEIILELGKVALTALWPPSSQLVFAEDVMVRKTSRHVVTEACNLGILTVYTSMSSKHSDSSLQAGVSSSLKRSSLRVRTMTKKKVEFFHKLGQEHCAGHYLAHLAENHPLQFDNLMMSIRNPRDALTLGFVLLSACGNSWTCAEGIIRRLNSVYFAEIWRHMSRYTRGKLEAEESRNVQHFIELCLQCNFESEAAGRVNDLLLKLFPWNKVVFTGMPAQTAVGFRYFLQHLDHANDIEHVYINGVPRKGTEFINDSSFETLSENLLQKYDQAACKMNITELEKSLQGLELPSKGDLAKTQLYQVFEKWESETPSSILALLDNLDSVTLKTLNLRHLGLARQSHILFDIFGNGGLSTLTHLDLANTGLENVHILELAGVLHNLAHLQTLILFSNKADDALIALSESMTSLSLRLVDISLLEASAESMRTVCENMSRFAERLNAFNMDGNAIDNACLDILTTTLPGIPRLQRLSLSPCNITDVECLDAFLESLKSVGELEALQITVAAELSSVFLEMVGKQMNGWRQLKDLQLGCSDSVDDMDDNEVDLAVCVQFLSVLDSSTNLQWLDSVNIRLPTLGFETLVKIAGRHNYKRLQYNRSCLDPDLTSIPKDSFLELI